MGAGTAYLAISTAYGEKQDDTWAIVYLNLENEIVTIKETLSKMSYGDQSRRYDQGLIALRTPDHILKIESSDPVRLIPLSGNLTVADSRDTSTLLPNEAYKKFHLWRYLGRDYLLRKVANTQTLQDAFPFLGNDRGDYILLWETSVAAWFDSLLNGSDKLTVYVLNRQGQLLYANSSRISQSNVQSRPLVQEFIEAPLVQMQLEFTDKGADFHGAFKEIAGTNLVVFLEMPKAVALEPVYRMGYTILALFSLLILLVFLLLQWPMRRLTAPLRELIWLTSEIQAGNYQARTKLQGLGELQNLHEAFDGMAKSLMEKEMRLEQYIEEQKEAVRIQAELNVAHSIQDNLLSHAKLPDGANVDLAFSYLPAQECAGDWYSSYYDETMDELLVLQADVSGHGVGAALYTAMISSLFEDMCQRKVNGFDELEFLERLNHVFLRTGQKKWHATFTILKFNLKTRVLDITAAGGTPYLTLSEKEGQMSALFKSKQTDPIGMVQDPRFIKEQHEPSAGDLIFLYTDGITEARNPKQKMYGQKRLKKSIIKHGNLGPEKLLREMLNDWRRFVDGEPQEDDVCLLALRV